MSINLDATDNAILAALQADGSLSNVRLAEHINLSPAATLARVKRLEQSGIISGYIALIDKEKLGYDLLCFVTVSLENHDVTLVENFRTAIKAMPEVIECHFLTGNSDYILKVAVQNRQSLEHFLVQTLTPVSGVARLQTSIVLNEVKEKTVLQVCLEEDAQ